MCLGNAHIDNAHVDALSTIPDADSEHDTFGHGIHYCLVAPLARLEARTGIGGLVACFPVMRLGVPSATLTRTSSAT
jgi:cytochrome P450